MPLAFVACPYLDLHRTHHFGARNRRVWNAVAYHPLVKTYSMFNVIQDGSDTNRDGPPQHIAIMGRVVQ